jgi:hypothetical protein
VTTKDGCIKRGRGFGTEGVARGPEEKALGGLVGQAELLHDGVPQVFEGILTPVLKGLERPIHEENLDALRLRAMRADFNQPCSPLSS